MLRPGLAPDALADRFCMTITNEWRRTSELCPPAFVGVNAPTSDCWQGNSEEDAKLNLFIEQAGCRPETVHILSFSGCPNKK